MVAPSDRELNPLKPGTEINLSFKSVCLRYFVIMEIELTQIPFLMLPEEMLHGNFYFKVQKTKISTLCLCLASLGISSLSFLF